MADPARPSMTKPSAARRSSAAHRDQSARWEGAEEELMGISDWRRAVSIRGKDQSSERRQAQAQRMRVAVHRMGLGVHLAGITDATAAVFQCVGVDALAIAPRAGDP